MSNLAPTISMYENLLRRCRSLLESLEWNSVLYDGPGCTTTGCPICGESSSSKVHSKDCELEAVLKELGAKT